MSDNVSQLQPQKKPGLGKRIAAFVLLAVLVAGGVAAYVFRDQLNLDALQRYVRYLNVSDDSKSGRFLYDESNSNQYAGLSGGLAVAAATGLSLYDKDGTETASIQAAMSVPVLKTGNTVALAYDAGGIVLEAASQKKGSVLHVASQRAILDADIAADDSICYLSSEPGYKSVLYVYNSQQSLIYRWLSADVLSTNPIWLCFAYVILVMPFAFRAIAVGLNSIDVKTLVEASRSLGASWPKVFFKVIIPNLWQSILSASFISIAVVLGEYTVASLLGRMNLQVALYQLGQSNSQISTAMSLLALLFGVVLLVALDLISDAMRKSREGK